MDWNNLWKDMRKYIKDTAIYFLIFFAVSFVTMPLLDYLWKTFITHSPFTFDLSENFRTALIFSLFWTALDMIFRKRKDPNADEAGKYLDDEENNKHF